MEQGSGSSSGAVNFEFTPDEMMNMEDIFEDLGEVSLNKEFCQEIAAGFSSARSLGGDPVVTWEQVQKWFQHKQRDSQAKTNAPSTAKLTSKFSDIELDESPSSFSSRKISEDIFATAAVRNSESEKSNKKGKIPLDLNGMMYEAQSAKDKGWYDVKQFSNFRHDKRTGELNLNSRTTFKDKYYDMADRVLPFRTYFSEVLVRFKGFDREEDEWVKVGRQVRKISIPLEPSECHTVKVGDDVVSYRVTRKDAAYYDARVVNIKRKSHDPSNCSCVFEVCYEHNSHKENVSWDKLCRKS